MFLLTRDELHEAVCDTTGFSPIESADDENEIFWFDLDGDPNKVAFRTVYYENPERGWRIRVLECETGYERTQDLLENLL